MAVRHRISEMVYNCDLVAIGQGSGPEGMMDAVESRVDLWTKTMVRDKRVGYLFRYPLLQVFCRMNGLGRYQEVTPENGEKDVVKKLEANSEDVWGFHVEIVGLGRLPSRVFKAIEPFTKCHL